MSKWFGVIGFSETMENPPDSGIWTPSVTEREYYGEMLRSVQKVRTSGGVNDDIDISNRLSIISDTYATEHLGSVAYVVIRGTKWKVVSVEVQRPRVILDLGGVWNE